MFRHPFQFTPFQSAVRWWLDAVTTRLGHTLIPTFLFLGFECTLKSVVESCTSFTLLGEKVCCTCCNVDQKTASGTAQKGQTVEHWQNQPVLVFNR